MFTSNTSNMSSGIKEESGVPYAAACQAIASLAISLPENPSVSSATRCKCESCIVPHNNSDSPQHPNRKGDRFENILTLLTWSRQPLMVLWFNPFYFLKVQRESTNQVPPPPHHHQGQGLHHVAKSTVVCISML